MSTSNQTGSQNYYGILGGAAWNSGYQEQVYSSTAPFVTGIAPVQINNHQVRGIGDIIWALKNMTWHCTNPKCGKPLSLAKKGHNKYQPAGVVVLECSHCGFEFMVHAANGIDSLKQKPNATKVDFDLAVWRKKVKEFELQ